MFKYLTTIGELERGMEEQNEKEKKERVTYTKSTDPQDPTTRVNSFMPFKDINFVST